MVLTTHVAFWTGNYGFDVWGTFLARLDAGVALFFVLSGFLLSRPYLLRARAVGHQRRNRRTTCKTGRCASCRRTGSSQCSRWCSSRTTSARGRVGLGPRAPAWPTSTSPPGCRTGITQTWSGHGGRVLRHAAVPDGAVEPVDPGAVAPTAPSSSSSSRSVLVVGGCGRSVFLRGLAERAPLHHQWLPGVPAVVRRVGITPAHVHVHHVEHDEEGEGAGLRLAPRHGGATAPGVPGSWPAAILWPPPHRWPVLPRWPPPTAAQLVTKTALYAGLRRAGRAGVPAS